MYGKAPKMASAKKSDVYKNADSAIKGAKKRGEPSITFMLAVSKPKTMPKAPKMMKKMGRGK